uniref:Uncharacterized protein n=1 Tax=Clytia hemisphaerica TaxID=252671 RepID=A0A7M5X2M8_9CNID|eukprot:TCONS_00035323-protein
MSLTDLHRHPRQHHHKYIYETSPNHLHQQYHYNEDDIEYQENFSDYYQHENYTYPRRSTSRHQNYHNQHNFQQQQQQRQQYHHQHQQHHQQFVIDTQRSLVKHILPKNGTSFTDKILLKTLNTTTELLNSYDKKVRWATDLVDVHTYKVPKTSSWQVLRKKFRKAVTALKDDIDL